MPMTALVEQYWREIASVPAQHAVPVRYFVLHADHAVQAVATMHNLAMTR